MELCGHDRVGDVHSAQSQELVDTRDCRSIRQVFPAQGDERIAVLVGTVGKIARSILANDSLRLAQHARSQPADRVSRVTTRNDAASTTTFTTAPSEVIRTANAISISSREKPPLRLPARS